MTCMRIIWQLLAGLGVIVLFDLLWLGVVMRRFYRQQIGGLLGR